MDSAARRLYVSHGMHTVVVDVDAGKVVGDIPDTQGVHGIAIASELNRGFTSNGRANSVTVFDLKTLKPTGTVKTGTNPDAILYDAASGRVFTFNGRSKDATAFDAKTEKVEATIPLGGKPEFSVADGTGNVFVNIEDTNEMVEIDALKLSVTKRYSLAPCDEPSGLAIDGKRMRLFSVCSNKVMIVSDPGAGKVAATIPIGEGPDAAGFDPGTGTAFSSNGEGSVTLVQETSGKWQAVGMIPTKWGARTMAVDTKTHRLFLPTAQFGPAPAVTAQNPRPRPAILPDTFEIVVLAQE